MVALGIDYFNSVPVSSSMLCRPVLASSSVWPANQLLYIGEYQLGIGHYHLSCRPLLASAMLDFWIRSIAILAGSASLMYTEFKIIPKICAFQYVCNKLVIEYSLVHAYYLETFPYILCCAYVYSCSLIEPQFPVLLFS